MNVPIRKRKGFTLIELLIVITIIGILAVALVPRISQGPARARDVQRKADMNNIAAAMELYYADTGSYPIESGTAQCLSSASGDPGEDIQDYLGGTAPTPPPGAIEGACGLQYYYASTDGAGYTIGAEMEILATTTGYYCDTPTSWYDADGDLVATACATGDLTTVYYAIER